MPITLIAFPASWIFNKFDLIYQKMSVIDLFRSPDNETHHHGDVRAKTLSITYSAH